MYITGVLHKDYWCMNYMYNTPKTPLMVHTGNTHVAHLETLVNLTLIILKQTLRDFWPKK